MNFWDDVDQEGGQDKWSNWAMGQKKNHRKMTNYVSALVFATAGIYVYVFGLI